MDFILVISSTHNISIIVPIDTGCKGDIECPTREACINKECQNPCTAIKPCAANAVCIVQNTLPLRTMICTCDEGYVGRGDVSCEKYSTYPVILKDFIILSIRKKLNQFDNFTFN